MTGGPVLPGKIKSLAKTRHLLNGIPITDRPAVNWQFGSGISASLTDDPVKDQVIVALTASNQTNTTTGALNLGAGAATATGYTLDQTVGTAVDLDQDLVIPGIASGWLILFILNYTVVAGTSSTGRFDILSVNSGLYAGEGIATTGWPQTFWPAAATTYRSVVVPYFVVDTDVAANAGVFRLMYRVDGGSTTLIKNTGTATTDGHLRLHAVPISPTTLAGGQNTGPPPVTPPPSGVLTDRGTTTHAGTDSTNTLASGSFTPTAGDIVYVLAGLHISGIDKATVNVTIADTFGDTGGTTWTKVTSRAENE